MNFVKINSYDFGMDQLLRFSIIVIYYDKEVNVWGRFLILLVESCSKLVISVTEHLVAVVNKLSTTAVVFFRSERILKCKCLYGA